MEGELIAKRKVICKREKKESKYGNKYERTRAPKDIFFHTTMIREGHSMLYKEKEMHIKHMCFHEKSTPSS